MRRRAIAAAPLLLALLASCASVPSDPAAREAFKANNDPLEPMNRKIFAFNQVVDRYVIKPVAKGYVRALPLTVRDHILNFLKNLNEPVVFVNDSLQGEGRRATITASRFVLNTTIGIAGVFDFAGAQGLPRQTGDFGQTLSVWGFHDGPYLMIPVWGPSSPRDALGSGVDIYLVPYRYLGNRYNYPSGLSASIAGLTGIDERSRNIDSLDEIQRESIDYYAAFRSFYRQHRKAVVERGVSPPTAPDDMYSDPGGAGDPGAGAAEPAARKPS